MALAFNPMVKVLLEEKFDHPTNDTAVLMEYKIVVIAFGNKLNHYNSFLL